MTDPSASTLEPLVVAAAGGDRDAFRRLVEATSRLVSAIALAELRDPEASKDVAQDVYLLVHADLPKLRSPRSFLPFLREVTRQRARRVAERRGRTLGGEPAEAALANAADQGPAPEDRLLAEERRTILHEAFDALPEDAREVLALYYLEGRSTAQLGELLGLGEAAVHQRLSRARGKLREDLLRRFADAAEAGAPGAAFGAAVVAALPASASGAVAGTATAALTSAPKWALPAIGGAVALAFLIGLLPRAGGPGGGSGPAPGAITVARPPGERAPGDRDTPPTPRDEPPPASSGVLRVRVTSAEKPVAGARVRAWRELPVAPAADRPAWRLAAEVDTGEDGAVDVPAASGRWMVSARAARLAAKQVELVRPEGEPATPVALALEPAVGLTGKVIERPGGAVVPLATLVLVRALSWRSETDTPVEERAGTVADATGAFAFPDAGPGTYVLAAEAPGRARTAVRKLELPTSSPLVVELEAAATIEGRVVDSQGRAAPNAELVLSGTGEVFTAMAGPSGGFAVEVVPGAYVLTAKASGETGALPSQLVLAAGQAVKGIVLRLGAGAGIEGRVTGAEGTPIAGAVMLLSNRERDGELARALTGADGRYAFGPLAAGEYDVDANADGRAKLMASGITLLPGERFLQDFRLEANGSVEGSVTDPDGNPVAGARIRGGTIWSGGEGEARAVSGTDGRYRLPTVRPGQTIVRAWLGDGDSPAVRVLRVEPGKAARSDFVLAPLGTVEGSVTREDGRPLEGVVQAFIAPERFGLWNQNVESVKARVDRGGRFRARVSAGAWKAFAVRTDNPASMARREFRSFEVTAGGTEHVELTLPVTPPSLTVEVTEPGGSPAAFASVRVERDQSSTLLRADEKGRVGLQVSAETVGVTVYARSDCRATRKVVAPGENPVRIELGPGAPLRGRVSDPVGKPVRGFTLVLVYPSGGGLTTDVLTRRFASDRFELAEVPAIPARLIVLTEDGRTGARDAHLHSGEALVADIPVELPARLVARVVDPGGKPLPAMLGAGIRNVSSDPEGMPFDPGAAASGVLRVGGLAPGEETVRIFARGYKPWSRTVSLLAGQELDLGTVKLEK
ncbi:MAG: sigma-70 family RNA polymerase sigma factor [Anaeromyxobacteraceae bacterium]